MDKGQEFKIPESIIKKRATKKDLADVAQCFEQSNEFEEGARIARNVMEHTVPPSPSVLENAEKAIMKAGGSTALIATLLVGSQLIFPEKAKADKVDLPQLGADVVCAIKPNSLECLGSRSWEDDKKIDTYEISRMLRKGIYILEDKKDKEIRRRKEELIKTLKVQEEISDADIDWSNTEDCRNYSTKLFSKYGSPEIINIEKGNNANREVEFRSYYNNNLKGEKADRLRYVVMVIKRKNSDITVELIQFMGTDPMDSQKERFFALYSKGETERSLITANLFGSIAEFKEFKDKAAKDFLEQWSNAKQEQINNSNQAINK